jgi:hypothetical protein
MKDKILIEFRTDGTVLWYSVGWKANDELMAKAKKAINDGADPTEVVRLLSAHFEVGELRQETEQ